MDFRLSDEQEMLRDGLTKFLSARYGLEQSRTAVKSGAGWQPEVWQAFADELGILGAALPEEVGGIGGGPGRGDGDRGGAGSRTGRRALRGHRRGGGGPSAPRGRRRAPELLERIVAGHGDRRSGGRGGGVRRPLAGRGHHRSPGRSRLGARRAKIMAVGAPFATHLLVTAAPAAACRSSWSTSRSRPVSTCTRTARSTTGARPTWC